MEEVSLARNVSLLRKALSDHQDGHTFIETIPKRGYRFVAPVEIEDLPSTETELTTIPESHSPKPSIPRPNQSLDHPLGVGGTGLMEWFFPTRTFQRMHNPESRDAVGLANVPEQLFGQENGGAGIDNDLAARGFENVGAWIIGRNMFGPVRGAWAEEEWRSWWGGNPPIHCDVFMLTHHARAPLTMEGGTTFHFVTDGIEAAWRRAKAAANGKDVRLGGGAATVRAYLRAGLVDELHLAQSPVLLGSGESLFSGLDLPSLGYRCVERVPSAKTTHLVLARS